MLASTAAATREKNVGVSAAAAGARRAREAERFRVASPRLRVSASAPATRRRFARRRPVSAARPSSTKRRAGGRWPATAPARPPPKRFEPGDGVSRSASAVRTASPSPPRPPLGGAASHRAPAAVPSAPLFGAASRSGDARGELYAVHARRARHPRARVRRPPRARHPRSRGTRTSPATDGDAPATGAGPRWRRSRARDETRLPRGFARVRRWRERPGDARVREEGDPNVAASTTRVHRKRRAAARPARVESSSSLRRRLPLPDVRFVRFPPREAARARLANLARRFVRQPRRLQNGAPRGE